MPGHLLHLVREFVHSYGYWTVAVLLLLEHAGIPLPGETTLLFASFLAYSGGQLDLRYIILSGTLAAALGGELGYAIGRRGGRPLLERYQHLFRIQQATLQRGERLFDRHGPATVFLVRFIFGMRILAGPLAGVLRMERRRFTIFNFLGAFCWVAAVSVVGYVFGGQRRWLLHMVKRVDAAIFVAIAIGLVLAWLRWRKRRAHADENASL